MTHTTALNRQISKGYIASVLLILSMTMSVSAQAKKVGGFDTPDSLEVLGEELMLNGAGVRTKLVIKVYVGALYLEEASQDAAAIIDADDPMAIRLQVRSGFLNREKMQAALLEGFEKSTSGDTSSIQSDIDEMMNLMSEAIKKKDVYLLAYSPELGMVISKNGTELGTVGGLEFKQALFGIWLSDSPAQASLKKAMLGQ